MQSSMIASGSSRFRSRTPGPDDRRSMMSSALGNSSDCIYSLGDSLSGLDLVSPISKYSACNQMTVDWPVSGLRRLDSGADGANNLDAFFSQRGFSRSELHSFAIIN